MRQSSTNSLPSECFVDSGRSLINARRRRGLRTVPCGTPDSSTSPGGVTCCRSVLTNCVIRMMCNDLQFKKV